MAFPSPQQQQQQQQQQRLGGGSGSIANRYLAALHSSTTPTANASLVSPSAVMNNASSRWATPKAPIPVSSSPPPEAVTDSNPFSSGGSPPQARSTGNSPSSSRRSRASHTPQRDPADTLTTKSSRSGGSSQFSSLQRMSVARISSAFNVSLSRNQSMGEDTDGSSLTSRRTTETPTGASSQSRQYNAYSSSSSRPMHNDEDGSSIESIEVLEKGSNVRSGHGPGHGPGPTVWEHKASPQNNDPRFPARSSATMRRRLEGISNGMKLSPQRKKREAASKRVDEPKPAERQRGTTRRITPRITPRSTRAASPGGRGDASWIRSANAKPTATATSTSTSTSFFNTTYNMISKARASPDQLTDVTFNSHTATEVITNVVRHIKEPEEQQQLQQRQQDAENDSIPAGFIRKPQHAWYTDDSVSSGRASAGVWTTGSPPQVEVEGRNGKLNPPASVTVTSPDRKKPTNSGEKDGTAGKINSRSMAELDMLFGARRASRSPPPTSVPWKRNTGSSPPPPPQAPSTSLPWRRHTSPIPNSSELQQSPLTPSGIEVEVISGALGNSPLVMSVGGKVTSPLTYKASPVSYGSKSGIQSDTAWLKKENSMKGGEDSVSSVGVETGNGRSALTAAPVSPERKFANRHRQWESRARQTQVPQRTRPPKKDSGNEVSAVLRQDRLPNLSPIRGQSGTSATCSPIARRVSASRPKETNPTSNSTNPFVVLDKETNANAPVVANENAPSSPVSGVWAAPSLSNGSSAQEPVVTSAGVTPLFSNQRLHSTQSPFRKWKAREERQAAPSQEQSGTNQASESNSFSRHKSPTPHQSLTSILSDNTSRSSAGSGGRKRAPTPVDSIFRKNVENGAHTHDDLSQNVEGKSTGTENFGGRVSPSSITSSHRSTRTPSSWIKKAQERPNETPSNQMTAENNSSQSAIARGFTPVSGEGNIRRSFRVHSGDIQKTTLSRSNANTDRAQSVARTIMSEEENPLHTVRRSPQPLRNSGSPVTQKDESVSLAPSNADTEVSRPLSVRERMKAFDGGSSPVSFDSRKSISRLSVNSRTKGHGTRRMGVEIEPGDPDILMNEVDADATTGFKSEPSASTTNGTQIQSDLASAPERGSVGRSSFAPHKLASSPAHTVISDATPKKSNIVNDQTSQVPSSWNLKIRNRSPEKRPLSPAKSTSSRRSFNQSSTGFTGVPTQSWRVRNSSKSKTGTPDLPVDAEKKLDADPSESKENVLEIPTRDEKETPASQPGVPPSKGSGSSLIVDASRENVPESESKTAQTSSQPDMGVSKIRSLFETKNPYPSVETKASREKPKSPLRSRFEQALALHHRHREQSQSPLKDGRLSPSKTRPQEKTSPSHSIRSLGESSSGASFRRRDGSSLQASRAPSSPIKSSFPGDNWPSETKLDEKNKATNGSPDRKVTAREPRTPTGMSPERLSVWERRRLFDQGTSFRPVPGPVRGSMRKIVDSQVPTNLHTADKMVQSSAVVETLDNKPETRELPATAGDTEGKSDTETSPQESIQARRALWVEQLRVQTDFGTGAYWEGKSTDRSFTSAKPFVSATDVETPVSKDDSERDLPGPPSFEPAPPIGAPMLEPEKDSSDDKSTSQEESLETIEARERVLGARSASLVGAHNWRMNRSVGETSGTVSTSWNSGTNSGMDSGAETGTNGTGSGSNNSSSEENKPEGSNQQTEKEPSPNASSPKVQRTSTALKPGKSYEEGSTATGTYTEGVTISPATSEVSGLTNPTCMDSKSGFHAEESDDDDDDDAETSASSSDDESAQFEGKKAVGGPSEASSSQTSEAAAPLIDLALRGGISSSDYFGVPSSPATVEKVQQQVLSPESFGTFPTFGSPTPSTEWKQETFDTEDSNDVELANSNSWDVEKSKVLFTTPSDELHYPGFSRPATTAPSESQAPSDIFSETFDEKEVREASEFGDLVELPATSPKKLDMGKFSQLARRRRRAAAQLNSGCDAGDEKKDSPNKEQSPSIFRRTHPLNSQSSPSSTTDLQKSPTKLGRSPLAATSPLATSSTRSTGSRLSPEKSPSSLKARAIAHIRESKANEAAASLRTSPRASILGTSASEQYAMVTEKIRAIKEARQKRASALFANKGAQTHQAVTTGIVLESPKPAAQSTRVSDRLKKATARMRWSKKQSDMKTSSTTDRPTFPMTKKSPRRSVARSANGEQLDDHNEKQQQRLSVPDLKRSNSKVSETSGNEFGGQNFEVCLQLD